MWARRNPVAVAALPAVLVLLSACDPISPEEPPATSTPEATGTPAAQDGPFSYCDLVDVEAVSQVAGDLGNTGGAPLQLADWFVDPANGQETCEYAAAMADVHPVRFTVRPDGSVPDLSPDAEPREDLGEGAFFEARFNAFPMGFVLAAPVADTFVSFYVEAEEGGADSGQAEEALRGLLDTASERLPADAAQAGLIAGEDCEELEDVVLQELEGPPDHSRYVAADGSFSCDFTSLEEHWRVGAKLWLGGAESWRSVTESDNAVKMDQLEDAWLIDIPQLTLTQVYVFVGPDLIRVDARGTAALVNIAEALTTEFVPIITGE